MLPERVTNYWPVSTAQVVIRVVGEIPNGSHHLSV